MPPFGPVERNELIWYPRQLGFIEPFADGRHQHMIKNDGRLALRNPHQNDIDRDLLSRILRQGDIDKDEWEGL